MRKEFLVAVVTSERTWKHLQKYCFNSNFQVNRHFFDLAVVLNGNNDEALNYIKQFSPDYLFVRPNLGLDPAGFDHLIKSTPIYDRYIFLHDDHWFDDRKWFETIHKLTHTHSDVDVFGNLVNANEQQPPNYRLISIILGYEQYQLESFPYFLQGMAGIFKKQAIEKILALDGFPHTHGNFKETAMVCERIFSFILLEYGFKFKQIPPGYQKYMFHRDET